MVTQQAGSLAGFDHSMFTHDGRAHEVFRAGTGPAVIVIHEARRPPRRALLHGSTRTSGHNEHLSRTAWVASRLSATSHELDTSRQRVMPLLVMRPRRVHVPHDAPCSGF